MFNYRVLQYGLIVFLAIIFSVVVIYGVLVGRDESRSKLSLYNANQILVGLGYFKKDQARYPSPNEFSDKGVMLNYFSVYPFPVIASTLCPQNFQYTTSKSDNFSLGFCLDSNYDGGKKGLNYFGPDTTVTRE